MRGKKISEQKEMTIVDPILKMIKISNENEEKKVPMVWIYLNAIAKAV